MKTKHGFSMAILLATGMFWLGGCGRDTRVNSDPGPGGPSAADTGKPAHGAREASKGGASGSASTSPTTGADSTGRPSDASGGTTGAGSGSGTSGTRTDVEQNPPRRQ